MKNNKSKDDTYNIGYEAASLIQASKSGFTCKVNPAKDSSHNSDKYKVCMTGEDWMVRASTCQQKMRKLTDACKFIDGVKAYKDGESALMRILTERRSMGIDDAVAVLYEEMQRNIHRIYNSNLLQYHISEIPMGKENLSDRKLIYHVINLTNDPSVRVESDMLKWVTDSVRASYGRDERRKIALDAIDSIERASYNASEYIPTLLELSIDNALKTILPQDVQELMSSVREPDKQRDRLSKVIGISFAQLKFSKHSRKLVIPNHITLNMQTLKELADTPTLDTHRLVREGVKLIYNIMSYAKYEYAYYMRDTIATWVIGNE